MKKLEESKQKSSPNLENFYQLESDKSKLEHKVTKLETELAALLVRSKKDQDQASIYEHHSYTEELQAKETGLYHLRN